MSAKKILIAEDDKVTLTLLSKTIEKHGFIAIQCSDGKRAWDTLKDNSDIDLLITDMKMPNLAGDELIKLVNEDEKLSGLPIIIISGVVKLSEIKHILDSGASRFLPKPINTEELIEYINRLLFGPGAAQELQT
ncbi:MAG: response regulator [Bdellovibrionales bacterium]|nr:response regulator [Bdellovibrionales bacterium]